MLNRQLLAYVLLCGLSSDLRIPLFLRDGAKENVHLFERSTTSFRQQQRETATPVSSVTTSRNDGRGVIGLTS